MAIHLNIATGFNLPPYWLNHPVKVLNPETADKTELSRYLGNLYQCSLRIKWSSESDSSWWTLPLDPVISISGKNNIVKRNVMKTGSDERRRGSIKELWTQGDYEVNIAGLLVGKDGEMPESDLRKLRRYCEARKVIEVESDLFCLFDIRMLVIESFDLPFTKGVENQMFTLKCVSEDDYDLLIEN